MRTDIQPCGIKRLRPPQPLPQADGPAQREWLRGWYAGLLIGAVNGAALAVLLGWVR